VSKLDFKVETKLVASPRVKQLAGLFDVPLQDRLVHEWRGDVPLDARPWQVGLIVGPSGAGKSSVMRQLFGEPLTFSWRAASVIDDFESEGMEAITGACSAVGFNTIPSWAKPYAVLSTGERFRVELARHLIEGGDPIVVDEFTSVIDRQVAQIGSHAVQKYVRRTDKKFVGVTCHYDVIDWLQPDWVLEPATMTFQWRAVQRRPNFHVEVARVDHAAWKLFAPFHYLTAELHASATCFVLFVDGSPASFIAVLQMPHPKRINLRGISRAVTLPDYQGLGLVMALESKVCGAYRAMGIDVRGYPAHPSHVRSLDRSPEWRLIKKPGASSGLNNSATSTTGRYGGRPCAVFEFCGKPIAHAEAAALLGRDYVEQRKVV
jgi:hypothetical protein